MTTDFQKSLAASQARQRGMNFEHDIEMSCIRYEFMKMATIKKIPEPFHILERGRKGRVTGYYEKQAQPDFQGTLSGGRSIVFEAKSTSKDQIAKRVLTIEQEIGLERHHKMGAIVFVLVRMNSSVYRIDWPEWKGMIEKYRRAHLKESDIQHLKIRKVDGIIDFLDGIEDLDDAS